MVPSFVDKVLQLVIYACLETIFWNLVWKQQVLGTFGYIIVRGH